MTAFVFKQSGLYKALSEDGWLLGAWEFYSHKNAVKYIPEWLGKDGYHCEFIDQYWKEDRVREAILGYEGNWQCSFDGRCNNS